MHKLIVPRHICHCNFIYTQFGHNHRPGYHQIDIFYSLYKFYIIEVLQILNCNNHCKSYGIPYNEYIRTVLYIFFIMAF